MANRGWHSWAGGGALVTALALAAPPAEAQCWGERARAEGYANPSLLASAQELADHLGDAGVRIVDARPPERYAAGHVPGAVSLPVGEITRTAGGVPGMLAPVEEVARALGERGVTRKARVVVYDDVGGVEAARLFWALEYLGHGRVSVLQGGFRLWVRDGRPIARDTAEPAPAHYEATPDAGRLADAARVKAALGDPGVVLLDARSPEEFEGKVAGKDVPRAGHIPGAVNVDWTRHLGPSDPPRVKEAADLAGIYRRAGVTADKAVIAYCRTGVRAAHTYFVLRLLGYPRVRVYDGSFIEWAADPSVLVARAGDPAAPAAGPIAYVAMGPGKAVAVVDLGAGRVLARLPLSVEPHGVATSRDGRRVIAADLTKGQALEVADAGGGPSVGRVTVGKGGHHLAPSPDGRRLAVTRSEAGRLALVDLEAMRVVADVETGAGANYALFAPDGRTVYVSNMDAGDVAVVDVATARVTGRMAAREAPGHMALSPDGRRLYVASERSGTLAALDPARGEMLGAVRVGNEPHGVAVGADGAHVYVSSHEDGTLSAVDAATLQVVRTVPVGDGPEHVEVTPDGRWLVVSRPEAGELVVLEAGSLAAVRTIAVGQEPHQIAFAAGR